MPEASYVGEPEEQEPTRPISRILKWGFLLAFVIPMSVVVIGSLYNSRVVPPYPERFVAPDGSTLATKADIMRGQHVFQEYGLMDQGTVWGHGSLRGVDFSAQSLHMVGERVRAEIAQQRFARNYDELNDEDRTVADALAIRDIRMNTYDPETGEISLSEAEAAGFREVVGHWNRVFW